ncbi:Helicase MOV-10, partial [Homalodisca vitripennis]
LSDVSESILLHSNYDSTSGWVIFPELKKILENDIIIVTIMTAGRLVTGGAEGMFKYVYIDECGQASEPESLVAIAGLITTRKRHISGQLVMAGDPEQLGPVLSSQLAIDFGLGISFLERLMKHVDLYKKDPASGYNNQYLTKLVQNYRSHPAILRIPNRLFYDNELEIKGNPDIINMAVGWEVLPNPQFPLIFHGIQGIDERESNSP